MFTRTVFSSVLVLIVAATSARGADLPVIRLTQKPVDDPWGDSAPNVLESRGVSVDADALRRAAPAVGARFVVPLGDGLELTAVVAEHELLSETRFTAVGQLDEDPFSTFLLVGNGSALVGSFRSFEHGTFHLRLTQGGGQVLRHMAPSAASCGVGSAASPQSSQQSSAKPLPGASDPSAPQQAITSADTGQWVDILIAYTPPAVTEIEASGYPVYQDHAVAAILDMNIRLNNSDVVYTLPRIRRTSELVLQTWAQPGPDTEQDLAHLKNPSDGIWDEVHPLRLFHGADLVHVFAKFLGPDPNLAGLAYRPNSHSQLSKNNGYGITKWDHGVNGVFAHELAHNFGCHHHPDDFGAGLQDVVQPWAFGHKVSGFPTSPRTTMAYPGSPYAIVPYFSTPAVFYPVAGPLGVADERDNARLMGETGPILAQYEASVTFVQESPPFFAENGTWTFPYEQLEDAVLASVPGHQVRLINDNDFTGTINKHIELSSAVWGSVVIGQ
jgi:hypothetical protein